MSALRERFNEWIEQIPLRYEFLQIPLSRWLVALAVFLAVLIVLRLAKAILVRRVRAFADKTQTDWDDSVIRLLESTKLWFLVIVSLYCGSLVLDLPEKARRVAESVAIITLLLQAAIWGNVLIAFAISRQMKQRMAVDAASVTTMSALAFVGRLALWTVVLLMILDNLGIDVTALVAGLGIGGIAVALAAQNILGDLFASMSIVLDKPFVLGDFIVVGDQAGTVEKIGLKTTRVRSLSGEQLVFANNDLLQSRVRNFKRMQERRILFTVGVTYQTPYEKLAAIPAMIREAVAAQEQVRFDRAHFRNFGDFSLNFEVVYYVLTADYTLYMDVQQAINLELYRRFGDEEIEFAYPTQTLYLFRPDGAPDGRPAERTGLADARGT